MGDFASSMPLGNGLGDKLVRQVNRFTSRGKFGGKIYGGYDAVLPVASGIASTAAIICQTRLLVAQAGITDPGTAAQLAAVNAAMATGKTTSWVNANLAAVTDTIQGYADSLGLPLWSESSSSGVSTQTIAIIAALGVGAYLLTRRS